MRKREVTLSGGGVSGALIAHGLASHGHEVALVEQRDVGWDSSAARTALLQQEIDAHMIDLAGRHGEDDAVLAYRACADANAELVYAANARAMQADADAS